MNLQSTNDGKGGGLRPERSTIVILAAGTILLAGAYFLGPEQGLGAVQIGASFIESPPLQLLASTAFMCVGALAAAGLALFGGLLLGTGTAFYTGTVGVLLKTGIDVMASIPRYILIILLFSLYGKGFSFLVLGVAIASVPTMAENIRNHIAEQLAQGRYHAFLAHGLSPTRIIWVHFFLCRSTSDVAGCLSHFHAVYCH